MLERMRIMNWCLSERMLAQFILEGSNDPLLFKRGNPLICSLKCSALVLWRRWRHASLIPSWWLWWFLILRKVGGEGSWAPPSGLLGPLHLLNYFLWGWIAILKPKGARLRCPKSFKFHIESSKISKVQKLV